MNLLIDNKVAAVLDRATFERVLSLYPEEEFLERPLFANAIRDGEIEFLKLKEEAAKIIIPWQMFLLDSANLDLELKRIEDLRHKVSNRLLAKRRGSGSVTSKRILDRLIRCQTYSSETHPGSKNRFCGILKGRTTSEAAELLYKHFGIDRDQFRRKNKQDALAYLVEKIESGQINVCQGVLTNKLLPHLASSRSVYKSTSGFVIRDEYYPIAFIPSEINPDEREGRQIFTLVFLACLIGLEAYEYRIDKDFKVTMLSAVGRQKRAYDITAEFLLPPTVTDALKGAQITHVTRDELSRRYKLSPSAVVVTLKRRGVITLAEYEELLPQLMTEAKKGKARTPSIEISVRKFNGKFPYEHINADLAAGSITPVRAQYLLFGAINKKGFKKYKVKLGL